MPWPLETFRVRSTRRVRRAAGRPATGVLAAASGIIPMSSPARTSFPRKSTVVTSKATLVVGPAAVKTASRCRRAAEPFGRSGEGLPKGGLVRHARHGATPVTTVAHLCGTGCGPARRTAALRPGYAPAIRRVGGETAAAEHAASAWATKARLEQTRVIAAANKAAGRTVVRAVRILAPARCRCPSWPTSFRRPRTCPPGRPARPVRRGVLRPQTPVRDVVGRDPVEPGGEERASPPRSREPSMSRTSSQSPSSGGQVRPGAVLPPSTGGVWAVPHTTGTAIRTGN